jgi:hypothetical protein
VPLRATFVAVYDSYPFWTVAGVVLLALRYWRGKAAERRQIRWLLIGVTGSFSLCVHIPVGHDQESGPAQEAGRERADA